MGANLFASSSNDVLIEGIVGLGNPDMMRVQRLQLAGSSITQAA